MSGWVGELVLDVRAPPSMGGDVLERAKLFAKRVLEAVAERCNKRWPGRVILLRDLPMVWRLEEGAFGDEVESQAVAAEITDSLAAFVDHASVPRADASVVVFENEAALIEGWLNVLTEPGGATEWYWSCFSDNNSVTAEDPTDEVLCEVFARLSRSGRLGRALLATPGSWYARFARLTAVDRVLGRIQRIQGPDDGARGTHSRRHDTDPSMAMAIVTAVAVAMGRPFDDPLVQDAAAATLVELRRVDLAETIRETSYEPTALSPVISGTQSYPSETRSTRVAGTVYLLRLAMDLGLGELLWAACLPEGRVFSDACALLLGIQGEDPLLRELSGPGLPGPLQVAGVQQAELGTALVRLAKERLTRHRGRIPAIRLGLQHTPMGRFLVGMEAGSPFALFVAPAERPSDVADGVARFLEAWGDVAQRLSAPPGLAAVDRSGRLRPMFDSPPGNALVLGGAGGPQAQALVSQVAGILGAVFATRVGAPPTLSVEGLAAAHWHQDGQFRTLDDELAVALPMESIDLAVRRSGLDRDPGWIPWLGKRVLVEFLEDPCSP